MNERKLKALKLRVVKLFTNWKEPHEETTYNQSDIVQSIDVSEQGIVEYTIAPKHPHCPCCLLDLRSLHQKTASIKGVTNVTITVMGVPASERWTREVNG